MTRRRFRASTIGNTAFGVSSNSIATGAWPLIAHFMGVLTGKWPKASLKPSEVNYIIVAGGASGGGGIYHSAGGGAGGYDANTQAVSLGNTYVISIGAGGAVPANGAAVGTNGANSSFAGIQVPGGGGGGTFTIPPNVGASGGGGSRGATTGANGIPTFGNRGGDAGPESGIYSTGGGGGAGANGGNGSAIAGGDGGDGKSTLSAILALANAGIANAGVRYIAGGGGGGVYESTAGGQGGKGGGGNGNSPSYNDGANGAINTGSGGGGSRSHLGYNPGTGGSGLVIVYYSDMYEPLANTTGSPTYIHSGGYNIYKFTGSGTITI